MKNTSAWIMLPFRLMLFLCFQLLIAFVIGSFEESQKYWLLVASAVNVVNIPVLIWLFKSEGKSFLHLFKIDKTTLKKDLLLFLGIAILCGPVVFLPNILLSNWLWGDVAVPYNMMFQPLSISLVVVLMIVFPVTIAFAELATYFGYIMPRLLDTMKRKWLAVLLPVIFLSIQHCALPFIPDVKFIVYRALVFLPFALLIGLILYKKPQLFPYFAILHGLMDLGTVMVLLR